MKAVEVLPVVLMSGLFVLIDFLALWATGPFVGSGVLAYSNPNDPLDLVYFFLALIGFTALILVISRFRKKHPLSKKVVQYIILGSIALLDLVLFDSLLGAVLSADWSLAFSIAAVAIILVLLVKNPEWYVIDISGIISSAGAIVFIGISLSVSIVIVLLVGMAAYDAISVYKTKHMIDLASTSLEQKLPVLFIIPKSRGYSFAEEVRSLKDKLRTGEKRGAFFLGLGDIIMPGILVVSAFHNLASNAFLMAVSVILGTLLGFIMLTPFVLKGKPQAGLPFLCTGAIIGYLIASFLIFGTFMA